MGTLGTKSSLANGLGFSKEPFENAKNETETLSSNESCQYCRKFSTA